MKVGTARLALIFVIAVASWLLVQRFAVHREPHARRAKVEQAIRLTERAFAVVDSVKRARGIVLTDRSRVHWRAMLGEDYTAMTTTLGSLEAKEVSTNPAWAGYLVEMLTEVGVRQGDTVGILASGSFPALTVSALSAISALEAVPLLTMSLGASSYGANLREATNLDLVTWIREAGVLDARAVLVSPGGEDDVGGGLLVEGRAWIVEAADRNGSILARFASLEEAVAARTDLFVGERASAVVNIGGGQAALGRCPHAAALPVGIWRQNPGCRCRERGALTRLAEAGVPVIHLLSVRRLAALRGLDYEPGNRYNDIEDSATRWQPRKPGVLAALAAILVSLVVVGRTRR